MITQVALALEAEFSSWPLVRPSVAASPQVGNLFLMEMPDSPDFMVGIYQYSGEPPRKTLGNLQLVLRPRMQIIVRDEEVDVALEKAEEIYKYIGQVIDQTFGGVRFLLIEPTGSIFELSPDKADRQRVACNYRVEVESH